MLKLIFRLIMSDRVLIIDDDAHILTALRRQLVGRFDISTSTEGRLGLSEVENARQAFHPFAAVVCDMNMPDWNGIETLRRIHEAAPDTMLIMLTGNADQQTAVNAINTAFIHRFFTKPCPIEVLSEGINDAVKQYRRNIVERELLEQTLAGSVKVLVDLVSVNDPVNASIARRIRGYLYALTGAGIVAPRWQLDLSTSLSLISQVALPGDLVSRRRRGLPLSDTDREALAEAPVRARNLIKNIPRLAAVAETVYLQERNFDGSGLPEDGPVGVAIPQDARIIKILRDLAEVVEVTGFSVAQAFEALDLRKGAYDPELIANFRDVLTRIEPSADVESETVRVDIEDGHSESLPPEEPSGEAPLVATDAQAALGALPNGRITAKPVFLSPSAIRRERIKAKLKSRKRMVIAAVTGCTLAVVGGLVGWYPFSDQEPEVSPEGSVLVAAIEQTASGVKAVKNPFGGTIALNNDAVEVTKVPRSVCIQASWQLVHKGNLVINDMLVQRVTGSSIARQCQYPDANVIKWTRRANQNR